MIRAQKPRIAAAGFQHETDVFAPIPTTFADFEDGGGWPRLTTGAEVIETFCGLNIPIGGFLSAAMEHADIVPILWTNAEPASFVETDAFDRISQMILDGIRHAGPLDGIYLDLHGAMVTEGFADGEGELLRRVRALCGSDMPLAVSLDLHANVSPEMVALADVITIYRTYPHLDMDTTGARAGDLLRNMVASGTRPAKAFRQIDRAIPLSAQCTDFGPLQALYGGLDTLPDVTSADIALGFPLSDVPFARPALVVYADNTELAEEQATLLSATLQTCAETVENPLLPPDEAVSRALTLTKSDGTVVLADVQDNSGAGAMADTTGLLKALIAANADRTVLGVLWDPEAVRLAHQAGRGACIDLALGGRSGPKGVTPFKCTVEVLALSDGVFTCAGAMQRDVVTDIGPTAWLKIVAPGSDVSVIVSSRRHQAIDQQAFRHIGADPATFRIVAVKSTVHFRADFAPIASEVLMVAAPGYSLCGAVLPSRSAS